MNTSPRRSVFSKHPPKLSGLSFASDLSPGGNRNVPPRIGANPISAGGGYGNSNKPPSLKLEDLLWSDMEDAFNVLAPQLYPLIETGKGPLEAAGNGSRELKKNCFCLLQLRPYQPQKPDWVFGKIKTSTPVNTLPDHLSKAEFLIPDTTRLMGILKLTSDDIYPSNIAKTWYVRVSAWVEQDEIDQLNASAAAFHQEGFHVEASADLKLVGDYVGLRLDQKKRQPWIYVVSSKWLAKLDEFQLYAVKANLRLLLEYRNRIIVNLLSTSAPSLNGHCDLKQGRDPLAFQQAETATEICGMLPELFTNLLQGPLKDLV